jgi:putative flippase GtrA
MTASGSAFPAHPPQEAVHSRTSPARHRDVDSGRRLPAPSRSRGLSRSPALRQVGTFAAIGVASTLAYVILYALLRPFSPAGVANAISLLVTALGNTAANRRVTFNVRGRDGLGRDHLAGLCALGAALAITSASLAGLGLIAPRSGRAVELLVLVVANALATLVRFLVLRLAIGGTRAGGPPHGTTEAPCLGGAPAGPAGAAVTDLARIAPRRQGTMLGMSDRAARLPRMPPVGRAGPAATATP